MADVRRLVELGMVPPLAKEVAAQITSGVGNARRLAELSMVPSLARELAAQITAKVGNALRLAELSMVPVLAREVVQQIGVTPIASQLNLILASQSWNSGRATSNQIYTPAGAGAQLFGNDYVMKALSDPIDSQTGQIDIVSSDSNAAGSFVPLMASRLLAKDGSKPITVIPCAKGGTSIIANLPGANRQDRTTLYGSLVYRALQVGNPTIVDLMIGQVDADNQMTKEVFKGHVQTFAAAIMQDLGCRTMLGKWPRPTNATTLSRLGPIWAAIDELWAEGGNIVKGADLSFVTADDDYHILYPTKNGWESDRRLRAYQPLLGQSVGPVPSINNIPKSNQFDLWTATAVTLTPNFAPNPLTGAMDASLVTVNNASVQKGLTSQAFSINSTQFRNHSYYVKPVDSGVQWLQIYGSSTGFGGFYKNFDIINQVEGAGVQGGGGVSGCIERVGSDGWIRIQASTATTALNAAAQVVINPIAGNTASKGAVGPTTGSFLIYGAQNEVRENAGDYVNNP